MNWEKGFEEKKHREHSEPYSAESTNAYACTLTPARTQTDIMEALICGNGSSGWSNLTKLVGIFTSSLSMQQLSYALNCLCPFSVLLRSWIFKAGEVKVIMAAVEIGTLEIWSWQRTCASSLRALRVEHNRYAVSGRLMSTRKGCAWEAEKEKSYRTRSLYR